MSEADQSPSDCLTSVRRAAGDAVLRAARDALERHPGDVRMLVDVGITLRDRGLYAEADRVFAHISAVDRHVLYGHYEAAVSCMLQGKHVEAMHHCFEALARGPGDGRSKLLLARLSAASGGYDQALALFNHIRETDRDAAPGWWSDYVRFVRAFPAIDGIRRSIALTTGPDTIDAGTLTARVQASLAERRPFSMIRLGDGEGAFLRLSYADESHYASLYRQNRLDRSHVWFAGQIDIYASGFFDETRKLEDVIQRADVIGVPYPGWLQHEYVIASPTGVSSLVNVLRFMERLEPLPGRAFTAQNVHSEMLSGGHLARLLSGVDDLTVISGHHSLPTVLQQRFDLKTVRFFDIPTEQAHAHLMTSALTSGPHYPDHYFRTLERIRTTEGLGLCLVAAGILGKTYCDEIKAAGGVALDIGSVADAWIGASTRPGICLSSSLL